MALIRLDGADKVPQMLPLVIPHQTLRNFPDFLQLLVIMAIPITDSNRINILKLSREQNAPAAQTGNIYADLSEYYDQFCAEVDYAEQCAFAERVFGLFSASDQRNYLDLACGTGRHLQLMAERGFVPSGLDNSPFMLAKTATRCPSAQLLLCDLAAFEHTDTFDHVTCFLYSIHYSYPVAALAETLRRTLLALKPGGLFIFNAVDSRGIRNDSGITTQLREGDAQLSFQSSWFYRGAGELLDLTLAIRRESSTGSEHWSDHHAMTALTLPELRAMLENIGFEVTMLEHDYTVMSDWHETSFNAIFVACKPLVKVAETLAVLRNMAL